jgi:hypothetical protein
LYLRSLVITPIARAAFAFRLVLWVAMAFHTVTEIANAFFLMLRSDFDRTVFVAAEARVLLDAGGAECFLL